MSQVFHDSFFAMGTRCHIVLPDFEPARAEQVIAVIRQEINRVETILSRFIPYSKIALINKKGHEEPIEVSDEIFQVLSICMDYSRRTEGAFDITLRKLLDYWKNLDEDKQATHELYRLMDKCGMNQIDLNESDQTVFLKNEIVEIDLGGFGKGYALHKIQEFLDDFSVGNVFISFGESSVITRGSHPAGDHWKIGISNHMKPGESIHEFTVNDGSISTSANFFIDNHGKLQNHRHVINPHSGYPVGGLVTVSVCTASPIVADILSTAYLVLSDEVMDVIINDIPPCDIVKTNYENGVPKSRILHKKSESLA